MAEEQNVNENSPYDFILQIIYAMDHHEMQMMIQIGYQVLMNPLTVLLIDMKEEDIPVDEPEPVKPAVVVEQRVAQRNQNPPRSFRFFVTKNARQEDVIMLEILNRLSNDPYMFME